MKDASNVFSHWSQLLEGLEESPLHFYESVEAALAPRRIPGAETSRVEYLESGILSAKREYLRVTRGKLVFDICGAPFGTGFFVSSWLTESPPRWGALWFAIIAAFYFGLVGVIMNNAGFFWGLVLGILFIPALLGAMRFLVAQGMLSDDVILAMPVIGALYKRFFRPDTYYAIDTTMMFQAAVHNALQDAVDGLTKAKGVRALTELERKPILRDFTKG